MSNFQQNFLNSLSSGMQIGQSIKQQRDMGQVNRLAGQAASASGADRTGLLNQMYQINPQMAAQQETALGASEDRRNKGMVQAARMLSSAPESMRPGLYQQMKPMLSQYGLQLPEQYDNTVAEAANALVQAYGGATDSMPSGLRQFQGMAGAAGLQQGSEQYQKAARVALGLEGRASGAGYQPVKFTGADGRERIGTFSGATGQITMPDGSTFDPRATGVQFTAIEESVSPQGGQLDFVSDFQQFQQSGIPISSTVRTDQRNREVGGTANSYHLTGEALDIAPRNAQEKAAAQQYWQSRGYQVIDEGDHLHVEPPSRGMTASRLGQQQRPASASGTFVGRTAEEEAAAVEQAKTNVQLGALPAELGMRSQAAINQAVGIEEGKAQAERGREAEQKLSRVTSDASNMLAMIERVKSSPGREIVTGLSGTIDPRAYLPGGAAADFRANLQQLQGSAFLQAFESLKGGGAITEIEGKKAEQAIAALQTDQSDEGFMRSIATLEQVIRDGVAKAQRNAARLGRGQQAAAPQQQVQRARNPQTGEVVEYRNGQWVKVQ